MSTARLAFTAVFVLALLAPGVSHSLAQPAVSPAEPASPTAPGAMLIVENAGQWPEAARFQVWNSPLGAGTTWLAEDAIWLVVSSDNTVIGNHPGGTGWQGDWEPSRGDTVTARSDRVTLSPPHPVTLSSAIALKLTFPGSNPDVRMEPFGAVDTTVSYFLGNDPEQWRPTVPVWGGVRYVDLYPGVDLVLGERDTAWRLEAANDAAVEQVRVQIEGAEIVALDGAALQLAAAGGISSLALPTAPFPYRVMGVSALGSPLTLVLSSDSRPSQAHQPADNPGALLFSTFLGGSGGDIGYAIAVDAAGSAYVTGYAGSSDFPTTPGAFDPWGYDDAFVVKLNPAGSGLVYATFLGGSSGTDKGYGIAVDGTGSVYVMGETRSSNFPTTSGAFDTSYNGYYRDAFVAKLNPAGSGLAYATFLGGRNSEWGYAIAVDGAGSAYVTGETQSDDFPTTPGAFDTSLDGYWSDAFVVKLNPAGSGLAYATFLGGSDTDIGFGIALDAMGSAYVTGRTFSGNFPATPGAFDVSFNGFCDAFVVKLNPAGNGLAYATFLGGSSSSSGAADYGAAIAVDGAGSAYVTGQTNSRDFPTTPGAFDPSYNDDDAFVAKFNPTGSGLDYATFLGGGYQDIGYAIVVDEAGSAYVTGETHSSDFPITPRAFDISLNGSCDAFVAKLNPAGSGLVYATFLGGNSYDYGNAIAIDGAGSAYVTGETRSNDFPTTPGAFDPSCNYVDAFAARLRLDLYVPDVLAPIEQPTAGTFVSGAVTLRGFAIDRASAAGTGIDMVHIYLDGPYGTGTIIGGATYGLDRPDIAAQYGARFGPSGWELAWDTAGLAPGVHRLYLYAHRTTDNAWSVMDPHLVVVPGGPARWLPIVLRQR